MTDTTTPTIGDSPWFIDADDTMLLLVDCQPGLSLAAASRPHQEFVDAVVATARTAGVFGVPTVTTTSARDRFSGPVWPRLAEVIDSDPIERHVLNAYLDDTVRAAIEATGRKRVLIAGALTEACIEFPALSLLAAGYEVGVVGDASAAITRETHNIALRRIEAAGGTTVSWIQLLLEWQKDWTHHETYAAATGILTSLGGSYGLAMLHAWDMLASPAADPKK